MLFIILVFTGQQVLRVFYKKKTMCNFFLNVKIDSDIRFFCRLHNPRPSVDTTES